jgi:hypothetical protein
MLLSFYPTEDVFKPNHTVSRSPAARPQWDLTVLNYFPEGLALRGRTSGFSLTVKKPAGL